MRTAGDRVWRSGVCQGRAPSLVEPVLFIRIFLATVGVISVMSAAFLVAAAVWRLGHPAPAALPVPREISIALTFTFLLSAALGGVCWIMVALSPRLWKPRS
jgi:hypothetical protein